MPATTSRPAATQTRRRAILDAALAAFTEHGLAAATIDDVRRRSGASVGSIYHHFGGKDELAAALYADGLRDYQEGVLALLHDEPEAEEGVRAIVAHHLGWVAANPDLARYLLTAREAEAKVAAGPTLRELNETFFSAVGGWLAGHVARGALAAYPRDLYPTLLVGPSQEFARHWLAGRVDVPLAEAETALADATWKSLRPEGG